MMDNNPRIVGAILAGGKASRYDGIAKGLLEAYPGITIIQNELKEMASSGIDEAILVSNDPESFSETGLEIVPDIRPGYGPLGGVEAALDHYAGKADAVLLLPCDLPGMTSSEIDRLKMAFLQGKSDVVFAVTGASSWHPLCAIVSVNLRQAVGASIDSDQLSIRDLWRKVGAEKVLFEDAVPFMNINTPSDLERWKEIRANRRK